MLAMSGPHLDTNDLGANTIAVSGSRDVAQVLELKHLLHEILKRLSLNEDAGGRVNIHEHALLGTRTDTLMVAEPNFGAGTERLSPLTAEERTTNHCHAVNQINC